MARYVVIGAGRQGTAAAYDMARWGGAERVVLADAAPERAARAAERVNRLVGREVAAPAGVDAADVDTLAELLGDADAALSAVPYHLNLGVTRAALYARTHLCDLGGNLEIARQQHALDDEARAAGVSVIPNCGQVPGMGTSLMVYAIEQIEQPREAFMWDGGLPQQPRPPFHYLLTFHIAGLTNEYAEPAVFLRNGEITEVEPMTELETVHFPAPIGPLEAFVTGGGTDTLPWTYHGKLTTLENKTLRYPGHFAQLRAFYDLGLWRTDPIEVNGQRIVPRDVFHALFGPLVTDPAASDLVVLRVLARGTSEGRPAEYALELIDRYDPVTAFTAMERCTGFSAAIVAEMAAGGQLPPGAGGVDTMVPAAEFVAQLRRRGFDLVEGRDIESPA